MENQFPGRELVSPGFGANNEENVENAAEMASCEDEDAPGPMEPVWEPAKPGSRKETQRRQLRFLSAEITTPRRGRGKIRSHIPMANRFGLSASALPCCDLFDRDATRYLHRGILHHGGNPQLDAENKLAVSFAEEAARTKSYGSQSGRAMAGTSLSYLKHMVTEVRMDY